MARILWVVAIMAVLETAWALYAAVTGVSLFLFWGGLVAASVAFWIPGLSGERGQEPQAKR